LKSDVRAARYREAMNAAKTAAKNDPKRDVKEEFFVADQKTTLAEAKKWLRARFGKGATCPCCNQFVKLYKRPFNKSMAYVLLLIACYFQGDPVEEWLHVPSYISEMVSDHPRRAAAVRGDWAKLKFWGLIEEKPDVRADGSPRVGYWKLTSLGRQFVKRQVKVPSHVYIYNGEPLQRVVEELITIDDALGTEFNYDEIMGAAT
jgi:hypothetical protein